MQKCQKCSKQFKWNTIVKSMWLGYTPIVCDSCGTKHYVNIGTRWVFSISNSIPLIIFILIQLFIYISMLSFTKISILHSFFGKYMILIYLLWVAIMTCITPFYARYHIKHSD